MRDAQSGNIWQHAAGKRLLTFLKTISTAEREIDSNISGRNPQKVNSKPSEP
jgi:hypothetical protein